MIDIQVKEECCGCRACAEICPKKAIIMIMDSEGFYYPKVNLAECIKCKKCINVCPVINKNEIKDKALEAFAGWAIDNDLRFKSSSGGIFGVIATYIINNNGVVYGAAFDEKMQLKVFSAETVDKLQPILKSKYLQCNNKGAYKNIKADLELGKHVLYMSTPCSITALKNYLNKTYDNLLTMDFVCHGVPSQYLFDLNKQVLEKKNKATMISYDFRDKVNKKPSPQKNRIVFSKEGKTFEISGLYLQDAFHCLFEGFNILRPSCYSCRFASLNRQSDITVGDFHNINKYMPNVNRFEGVSMIIVNSEVGGKVVYAVRTELALKKFDISILQKENECLHKSTTRKKERDIFFAELNTYGFDYVANKYVYNIKNRLKIMYYYSPKCIREIIKRFLLG